MIELAGTWFDGRTSRQTPARLRIYRSGEYQLDAGDEQRRGLVAEFEISPALGNTARQLTLPGGEVFETSDSAALAQALEWRGERSDGGLVHALERHWGAVLLLAAGTVLFVYVFTAFGVPALARTVAFAVPASFLESSDEQSIKVLDRVALQPSRLAPERREALREAMLARTPDLDQKVNILFRAGGRMGANAFALPGGTIVFTDELVILAANDEQLLAVYGHELGHLDRRHGLRRALQGSIVAIAATLVTGDATATSDLLAAVPLMLTDLAWSRDFEREADAFALDYLNAQDIDPASFAGIMQRLECRRRASSEGELDAQAFDQCLTDDAWIEDAEDDLDEYLFTHPPSDERIRRFRDATSP